MAHALALRGWGFDTLGDYQEAKRLYERALALEPFDTVAFSGLLGILHDREFDFPASFQHAKRWLDRFPNDTSRVIEVVEAMVTLGGPKPLAVIDALRNWRLPLERRMVVNALELVALAAVGDESALRQRKYELLELAMAAPPNMNYHWSFRGTLHYLSGLTTPHCGCISRVLTGIERNDQRMIVDALR
jgi:tetratricopeptide (TPR) repeat protein